MYVYSIHPVSIVSLWKNTIGWKLTKYKLLENVVVKFSMVIIVVEIEDLIGNDGCITEGRTLASNIGNVHQDTVGILSEKQKKVFYSTFVHKFKLVVVLIYSHWLVWTRISGLEEKKKKISENSDQESNLSCQIIFSYYPIRKCNMVHCLCTMVHWQCTMVHRQCTMVLFLMGFKRLSNEHSFI